MPSISRQLLMRAHSKCICCRISKNVLRIRQLRANAQKNMRTSKSETQLCASFLNCCKILWKFTFWDLNMSCFRRHTVSYKRTASPAQPQSHTRVSRLQSILCTACLTTRVKVHCAPYEGKSCCATRTQFTRFACIRRVSFHDCAIQQQLCSSVWMSSATFWTARR